LIHELDDTLSVAADGLGRTFEDLSDEPDRPGQGSVGEGLERRNRGDEQRQRRLDQPQSNRGSQTAVIAH
jgi:hypothetical protein